VVRVGQLLIAERRSICREKTSWDYEGGEEDARADSGFDLGLDPCGTILQYVIFFCLVECEGEKTRLQRLVLVLL
jgi:hypothetical protein